VFVSSVTRLVVLASFLLIGLVPIAARAQTPAQRGRLVVTVADPSGAVIPGATVTAVGLEPATRAATIDPVKTTDKGLATIDALIPGRYTIGAEFPGFELGLLRDVRITRGDNKHVVVLPLKNMSESVTVGRDGQAAASDRGNVAFGTSMSAEQIQALSDDPTEMARQLDELAGPGAIVRIDSFEGQQLPPKSQIKSIHVTRDQFAAETEQPGSTFVDVITQPGIGDVRGGANFSFRDGSMSAKSQFTPTKGAEQIRNYGANLGGALIRQKSNFSLSMNGTSEYSTPNLNAVLPTGTRSEVLNLRQPDNYMYVNGLLDYALTKDQTLRFGYSQSGYNSNNQGIGAFDLPERAYAWDSHGHTFRALEAGPIGRRFFINTRVTMSWSEWGQRSAVEAPTVRVQDAFTSGGAQVTGSTRTRNFLLASDLDYVRGINSWRTGIQINGGWFHADNNENYLGTYTFSSLADYQAGLPQLYTREVGDPVIAYFNAQAGVYFQDDVRVKKGLTLSPGVRYSIQTHVGDHTAIEPRFGITWAPFKSGKTTLRASAGIFHGWLPTYVYQQTLRFNGTHQRELVITNPSYPDPGAGANGFTPPTNEYRLGDYQLQHNLRYSGGFDQAFSPRFRVNVLYNYYHQEQLPRGRNLNALVNGVRPIPSVANIFETVTDSQIRRHELYVNFNLTLLAPSPGNNRAFFNWRRLTVNGTYAYISAQRNAVGPFDIPPSGSLDTEWGPGPADQPYRINLSLNSSQIRNLAVSLSWNGNHGFPYNLTTGTDDNHDGVLNDRPAGVGLNSLRTTPQSTLNGRFTYTLTPGAAPGGTGGPPPRYRFGIYVSVNNLTNRANYGGFSGVMTSPFFLRPTAVNNPRKVDMGLNVSF
jgi:hypothetical protein